MICRVLFIRYDPRYSPVFCKMEAETIAAGEALVRAWIESGGVPCDKLDGSSTILTVQEIAGFKVTNIDDPESWKRQYYWLS